MSRRSRYIRYAKSIAFLVVACVIACVLFLFNRLLTDSLFVALAPAGVHDQPKIRTLVLLLVPVALLVPEWWSLDAMFDGLGRLVKRRG